MTNNIIIHNISKKNNRIDINWEISGNVKEAFRLERPLFFEYSEFIEDVPDSIAVIPFVCNVLPIVWLYNATLTIEEIDAAFYNCLSMIKKGYQDMYPDATLTGCIEAKKLTCNSFDFEQSRAAVFFSGGVDSYGTLLSHLDEKPDLITLIGADIALDDVVGNRNLQSLAAETAAKFNLNHVIIKSSFRACLIERVLNKKVSTYKTDYWPGFQHGIAICAQAFPYAYRNKISTVYIASSYASDTPQGTYVCASDPTIDNHLCYASGRVIHDGYYNFTRQTKVKYIHEFSVREKTPLELRVCWQSRGGKNCSHCEKCYRTMLALLLEGADPNDYGFVYTTKTPFFIKWFIKYLQPFNSTNIISWKRLQNTYRAKKVGFNDNNDMSWIDTIDFENLNHTILKRNHLLRSIQKRIFNFLQ